MYDPVSPDVCARRSAMKILNLLSSSLPVSASWVLRVVPHTSTSLYYHLVPKHFRATWPRPEQYHLLPEAACSPNGADNRRLRQRRTKRPPPEPAKFLRDFTRYMTTNRQYHAKKVSKLNCLLDPFVASVPKSETLDFSWNCKKNSGTNGLIIRYVRKHIAVSFSKNR